MSKLELIKTKLAKLLLQFATIKTDKAVLEYDGEELAVGTEVFITDENGERKPAEDGNYVTEDEKTIVVADGKVTEILEKENEVEPEEEAPADETNEEVTAEEETPAEEVSEEVVEEVPSEESNDLTERLTALEAKVEELIAIVEKLVEKSETDSNAVEERLSKIEKMSAAKPVEEELEITKTSRKTGDAKMDARIAKATAMSKDWRY
jgi:hypothetical protein